MKLSPALSEKIIFWLSLEGTQKLSAKGIKRSAQRELVNQTFRDTLFTGKTMRVYNYNIVSKGHTNMTVKQNKLAISSFDSKSFLLFDGISTVPFGHKAAEENAFLEDIYMVTEWANSYNETDNFNYRGKKDRFKGN